MNNSLPPVVDRNIKNPLGGVEIKPMGYQRVGGVVVPPVDVQGGFGRPYQPGNAFRIEFKADRTQKMMFGFMLFAALALGFLVGKKLGGN